MRAEEPDGDSSRCVVSFAGAVARADEAPVTVGRSPDCAIVVPRQATAADGAIPNLPAVVDFNEAVGRVIVTNPHSRVHLLLRDGAGRSQTLPPQGLVSPPEPEFCLVLRGSDDFEVWVRAEGGHSALATHSHVESPTLVPELTDDQLRTLAALCEHRLTGNAVMPTWPQLAERLMLSENGARRRVRALIHQLRMQGLPGLVGAEDRWELSDAVLQRSLVGKEHLLLLPAPPSTRPRRRSRS